jgi:hypothetical protein
MTFARLGVVARAEPWTESGSTPGRWEGSCARIAAFQGQRRPAGMTGAAGPGGPAGQLRSLAVNVFDTTALSALRTDRPPEAAVAWLDRSAPRLLPGSALARSCASAALVTTKPTLPLG